MQVRELSSRFNVHGLRSKQLVRVADISRELPEIVQVPLTVSRQNICRQIRQIVTSLTMEDGPLFEEDPRPLKSECLLFFQTKNQSSILF